MKSKEKEEPLDSKEYVNKLCDILEGKSEKSYEDYLDELIRFMRKESDK